ncbi:MAG: hypothetical protein V3V92_00530, partial [Candidatus Hydrothermarchaeales archaeon]
RTEKMTNEENPEKKSRFSGFYKLTPKERLKLVGEFAGLRADEFEALSETGSLGLELADGMIENVDVAGNVCETGDILARDRLLPQVEENDLVAFLDAGAYCSIMASQYNLRPRPAEVLVRNGEYELIRERETVDDLYLKQRVPEHLLK